MPAESSFSWESQDSLCCLCLSFDFNACTNISLYSFKRKHLTENIPDCCFRQIQLLEICICWLSLATLKGLHYVLHSLFHQWHMGQSGLFPFADTAFVSKLLTPSVNWLLLWWVLSVAFPNLCCTLITEFDFANWIVWNAFSSEEAKRQ